MDEPFLEVWREPEDEEAIEHAMDGVSAWLAGSSAEVREARLLLRHIAMVCGRQEEAERALREVRALFVDHALGGSR